LILYVMWDKWGLTPISNMTIYSIYNCSLAEQSPNRAPLTSWRGEEIEERLNFDDLRDELLATPRWLVFLFTDSYVLVCLPVNVTSNAMQENYVYYFFFLETRFDKHKHKKSKGNGDRTHYKMWIKLYYSKEIPSTSRIAYVEGS